MRCMEAVIAPLRRQGIRLATYLDDWDEQEAKAHTCVLLRHLLDHGIVINGEKSVLSPARDVVFLGLSLNSMTFMVRLSAERIKDFLGHASRSFMISGKTIQFSLCLRLLGLMASAILRSPSGPPPHEGVPVLDSSMQTGPCAP